MSLERVTRVSEALYRVTDLMPDTEPLKWTLRTKAIELVELMSDISTNSTMKHRVDTYQRIQELIQTLTRLLDIAAGASFISRVNFEVLQREYGLLREIPQREELVLFPLPDMPTPSPAMHEKAPITESVSHGGVERTTHTERTMPTVTMPIEKGAPHIRQSVGVPQRTVQHKDSGRSERILSYLGAHPWASRGDVAAIFGREISEKTLQRELAHLVDTGVIVKEGEKRWCRYSLKGQKK